MSRIGNQPIEIPKGVTIKNEGRTLAVKGPKGSLSFDVPEPIECSVETSVISFSRPNNDRKVRALHGLARAMANNMVVGCSDGFTRILVIEGVGYRAIVKGSGIDLTLGFSHPVHYPLPEGVKAVADKDGKTLTLTSSNKAVLGRVAADIRGYRPPEPYKGKGVRYKGEHIIRKEGKARGKK
jgi:large subunit ribosomal protein L6